jgi:predicted transcriptional regulator YheO
LIGMLCINYDQSKCKSIIEDIQNLFQILPQTSGNSEKANPDATDSVETFPESIADMITSILHSVLHHSNIPRERLTQKEKIEIVNILHQKGVFLLKGAVSETAAQLCSSEATIYRYLNKINKQR